MRTRFRFIFAAAGTLVCLTSFHASGAWQAGLMGGAVASGSSIDKLSFPATTNIFPSPEAGATTVSPPWAANTTWIYWGQMYFDGSTYWFAENLDDAVYLTVGGTVVLDDAGWSTPTCGSVTPGAGWHPVEIRLYNGSGGAGPYLQNGWTATKGIGYKIGGAASTAGGDYTFPVDPGDRSLFQYDDGLGFGDLLLVSGSPADYGQAIPPYGPTNNLAEGASFVCSASPAWTNGAQTLIAVCDGYTVRTGETWATSEVVDSGTAHAFTYTHGETSSFLQWRFALWYRIDAAAGEGGSVDVQSAYAEEGTSVTITATPSAGYTFFKWEGDFPAGEMFNPSISLLASAPKTVSALFAATGSGTDKVFIGANNGDWDTASNWTPAGVPTINDNVYVPEFRIVKAAADIVARAVTVSNAAIVSVNGAGDPTLTDNLHGRKAADTVSTTDFSMTVHVDVTLLGNSRLAIGGTDMLSHPDIVIGGDLTLGGTSQLILYPGIIDGDHGFAEGGASVSVAGTTTVGAGCWIYPYAHRNTVAASTSAPNLSSGAPVFFRLRNLVVDQGGGFNADGTGYTRFSTCPAGADASVGATYLYRGGSYGGRGGSDTTAGGPSLSTYGFALAPFHPGLPGGNGLTTGGGVIRIDAAQVTLDGTLTASGPDTSSAGNAGGGIWVTCEAIEVGDNAVIRAAGGDAGSNNYHSGGGGGGRVAIGIGLTSYQLSSLYATGTADNIAAHQLKDLFPGRLAVGGGDSAYSLLCNGAEGSAWMVVNRGSGVVGTVLGAPSFIAATTPVYGAYALTSGASFPASVVSPAAVPTGGTTARRVCTGYVVTNAAGAVLAQGATASLDAFTVPQEDFTLVWKWETVQYRLDVAAVGGGSVATTGDWYDAGTASAQITATPASPDYVFAYWMGDVDAADRFDNPLVVTMPRARAIKAFFAAATPAAYTWTAGNAGNFHDAAKWTPAGIPGPADSAAIGVANANVLVDSFAKVATLAMNRAATLRLACAGTGSDVTVQTSAGQVYPVAIEVTGDCAITNGARLAVGGDGQKDSASFIVGGDLYLNSATVAVYGSANAAATNDVPFALLATNGLFRVAGTATLDTAAWIHPISDYRTGGSPLLDCGALAVAADAGFNANSRGYQHYKINDRLNFAPWPGHFSIAPNSYFGATHAGRGGNTVAGSYTAAPVYGYTNGPVHPGMQGGNGSGKGGGAIRIHAGSVNLAGALLAKGSDGAYTGGAAGGSVWIDCDRFAAAPTAVINVNGGAPTRNGSGGGGAGRATVTIGLTADQTAALRVSDDVEGVSRVELGAIVAGFTALGGQAGGYTGQSGEDGTGVYLVNLLGSYALNVAGNPENAGTVVPPYGMNAIEEDATVNVSSASHYLIPGTDARSRRVCGGYTVTNVGGATVASGGLSGSFTMTGPLFLTWDWATTEHLVRFDTRGSGSILTNSLSGDAASGWLTGGTTVSVTAVPEAGHVFAGWLGDGDGIDRTAATLVFENGAPRHLTALFVSSAAGPKTWIGGTGDWLDDAGWEPAGVPGPQSQVLVPSGDVLLDYGFVAPLAALEIGAAGRVRVSGTGTSLLAQTPTADDYATDTIGFRIDGDLVIAGHLAVGGLDQKRLSALSVDGNLDVAASGALLAIYAGNREPWGDPECYRQGGGRVTVGGTTTVGAGAWIYPFSDGYSGVPVVFSLNRLGIAEGGGFNAVDGGVFMSIVNGVHTTYCPGAVAPGNSGSYSGGSYGGKGGGTTAGPTYGKAFAPYQSGSPAGNTSTGKAYDRAGGAVRIDCKIADIAGSLLASGHDLPVNSYNGAASGGSIWLTCRRLAVAETAVIDASGGNASNSSGPAASCGGGGGRICIAVRFGDEAIADLYTAVTLPPSVEVTDLLTSERATDLWPGTVDVSGGTDPTYQPAPGNPGTAYYLLGPADGSMLILR